MKAIILAAGYATRLYPLTLNRPKALLEINGKAIIDYIIDEINTIDEIDAIYVVTNHKFADHFSQWASKSDSKKPIEVIDDGTTTEETRRGAIGDILYTIDEKDIDDETVIIAGDNFFTYKLKDYVDYYKKVGDDCVCVKELNNPELCKSFAVVLMDENGKVIEIEEKPENPKSDKVAYATYMYTKDTMKLIRKYIEEGNKPDAPGHFPEWLCGFKDVYAYVFNGECYDIGTPESYREVCELFGK